MGSAPDPPKAPDPVKTANAQTGMNIDSAIGTQLINQTNQVTPQGNLTYNQTGMNSYVGTDANGKQHTYYIPQFTATQTYSPSQQALYDKNNATQQNIADIGVTQSKKIGDLLNTPLNLDDDTIDNHLYQQYSPRVLAQQQRQKDAIDAQLAAQGVTAGSEAYNNAQTLNSQANTDQWNQLYLGGRNQAMQQMTLQRQEPINEINALMSGSQVSNPTFGQTPSTNIAPANYEQDVMNSFNAQMQGYNAQQQSSNAMMGGIFGTVGALGSGLIGWSDRRLKTGIRKLGRLANGLDFYAYRFKWGGPVHVGLMADEVERVRPWAVSEHAGYKMVNYQEAVQ